MNNSRNVVPMAQEYRKTSRAINPDVIDKPRQQRDNRDGGDNMKPDYVSHKEFDDAISKIDKQFDHIDKNFSDLHLALYKEMVGVALGAVAIVSVLITLFTFMK